MEDKKRSRYRRSVFIAMAAVSYMAFLAYNCLTPLMTLFFQALLSVFVMISYVGAIRSFFSYCRYGASLMDAKNAGAAFYGIDIMAWKA